VKQAKNLLRLATRESKLALWQAEFVQKELKRRGIGSELVPIKSEGDLLQKQPVQTLNTVGIFTKAIDDAVLEGRADAGVHSLKDLPTTLHKDLKIGAVLEREDARDVLIYKDKDFFKNINGSATIATGSARRRAQWLHQYSQHTVVPVRGNVDSRLTKLEESNWDGMILAAAGLKRLGIKTLCKKIEWMTPAPGQGAIVIVNKKTAAAAGEIISALNHTETYWAVLAERAFLHAMEGGCTAPIGAYAVVRNKQLLLKGEVLSVDGKEKIYVELIDKLENAVELGKQLAHEAIKKGAKKLLKG
jgi:hydroxymethylbilane synthase